MSEYDRTQWQRCRHTFNNRDYIKSSSINSIYDLFGVVAYIFEVKVIVLFDRWKHHRDRIFFTCSLDVGTLSANAFSLSTIRYALQMSASSVLSVRFKLLLLDTLVMFELCSDTRFIPNRTLQGRSKRSGWSGHRRTNNRAGQLIYFVKNCFQLIFFGRTNNRAGHFSIRI